MLTRKDIERIEEKGYRAKNFLEPADRELESMPFTLDSLKNREDGACIFLKFEAKQNRYECSIYDDRPILCRFYPFDFDLVGSNFVVLKFIPCCRGLNDSDGELVDERFITKNLLAALIERLETK